MDDNLTSPFCEVHADLRELLSPPELLPELLELELEELDELLDELEEDKPLQLPPDKPLPVIFK